MGLSSTASQPETLDGPVLVIDDDDDIRETLEHLLELNGWTVTTAASGERGLDRLRRTPRPTMILLDLVMPGLDGFAFRATQLGDPALATIPTVILTGGSLTAHERARLGDVEVLIKPVTAPA